MGGNLAAIASGGNGQPAPDPAALQRGRLPDCCSIRSPARPTIEVNISVGKIFSVLRLPKTEKSTAPTASPMRAFLQVPEGTGGGGFAV